MTDRLSPERRSWLMSRIGSKNTTPELVVRSIAHCLGYRFRLHRKELPGTPDLVFPKMHKIIFVNGCFWHGHYCKLEKMPKSKVEFWATKIEKNRMRDRRNLKELKALGWKVLVVWECQTKRADRLRLIITKFLYA
jgi:DNA mismatch endonuclease, patch repair protein